MGRTKKTAPVGVILKKLNIERHDHRYGQECDLDQWDIHFPWKTHCRYIIPGNKYSDWMKFFGRPKSANRIENMLERRYRRKWKNAVKSKDPDDTNIGRLDSAWFID